MQILHLPSKNSRLILRKQMYKTSYICYRTQSFLTLLRPTIRMNHFFGNVDIDGSHRKVIFFCLIYVCCCYIIMHAETLAYNL